MPSSTSMGSKQCLAGSRRAATRAPALLACAVVVVTTSLACQRDADPAAAHPAPGRPVATSQLPLRPVATPPPAVREVVTASFTDLATQVDGSVGLAIAAVGNPDTVQSFGDWSTGPAWSTAKVPLVIAAIRSDPGAAVSANMSAAITRSDNAAAELIWDSLGEPDAAASKVSAVLVETGDPTVVQSQRVRPQFTAFGQTVWSLAHQAGFLAATACDPRATPVLTLMGQIDSGQRWGLGTITGAQFKGGWGPDTNGNYLVRQFGILPTGRGSIAVAIAAAPSDGTYASGISILDTLAGWLSDNFAELPSGHCG